LPVAGADDPVLQHGKPDRRMIEGEFLGLHVPIMPRTRRRSKRIARGGRLAMIARKA
jgi:hypothetical protein